MTKCIVLNIASIMLALLAPLHGSYLSYVATNVRSPKFGQDAKGFLYIAATANSAGFYATPVPNCPAPPCRDEIPTRYNDVVVMKVDPASGEILYRTYLSASADEDVYSMAVSPQGVVYFSGGTNSPDFPVTPDALYPQRAELASAYLARVRPDGFIDYVTFFDEISIADIAVDSQGELILLGAESLIKLNSTADKILWRRDSPAAGTLLALGPDDSIYLAGVTTDAVHPAPTPGAFQTSFEPSFCGGRLFSFRCGRQFVTKFDADATRVVYSTFVTGEREEIVNGLAVDPDGSAYLTGATSSQQYPTTAGAIQRENHSRLRDGLFGSPRAYNAYATKVSPDGSALVYSTYLGGSGMDSGFAIALDAEGRMFLTGSTTSRDFPARLPYIPGARPMTSLRIAATLTRSHFRFESSRPSSRASRPMVRQSYPPNYCEDSVRFRVLLLSAAMATDTS